MLLWERKDGELRELDLGLKEVSLLLWSRAENVLAIGTSKGVVFIYDHDTDTKIMAGGRQRRTSARTGSAHHLHVHVGRHPAGLKVKCLPMDVAFGGKEFDEHSIVSVNMEGKTILLYNATEKDNALELALSTAGCLALHVHAHDRVLVASCWTTPSSQVKVKCLPMDVAFGGKEFDEHSIVSVNMEGKTILLYNATEKDNALELAFQAKYGSIVAYNWFSDGYIVAGFSSGFVVVISTRVNEIGREQFCARFQKKSLRDIKHSSDSNRIACCGDSCVKVIDMQGWVEECTQRLPEEAGGLGTLGGRPAGGSCPSPPTRARSTPSPSERRRTRSRPSQARSSSPWPEPLSPACVFCSFCAILLSGAVFAAATCDLPLALLVGELLTPTSL